MKSYFYSALLVFCGIQVQAQEEFQVYRELSLESAFGITDFQTIDDEKSFLIGNLYAEDLSWSTSFLVKVNTQDLAVEWAKSISTFSKDEFNKIIPITNERFMILGTNRQSFALQSGASYYIIDGDGNILDHQQYSGSYDYRVLDAFEHEGGDFTLIVRKGVNNQPSKVVHVDSDGSIISQYNLELEDIGVVAQSACWNGDDTYYICGSRFNGDLGYSRTYVAAFKDSEPLWYKQYDNTLNTGTFNMIYTSDDGLLLVGNASDPNGVIPLQDMYAMKLNSDGDVLWAKTMQVTADYSDIASGVMEVEPGIYHMTGSYYNEDFNNLGLMLRLNSAGDLLTQEFHVLGSSNFEVLKGYDGNGRLVTVSSPQDGVNGLSTIALDGRHICGAEEGSILQSEVDVIVSTEDLFLEDSDLVQEVIEHEVASLDFVDSSIECSGVLSLAEEAEDYSFQLYPNPASDHVVIEPGFTHGNLEIFTLQGQMIKSEFISSSRLELNVSTYPAGAYLIRLISRGTQSSRLLIVE